MSKREKLMFVDLSDSEQQLLQYLVKNKSASSIKINPRHNNQNTPNEDSLDLEEILAKKEKEFNSKVKSKISDKIEIENKDEGQIKDSGMFLAGNSIESKTETVIRQLKIDNNNEKREQGGLKEEIEKVKRKHVETSESEMADLREKFEKYCLSATTFETDKNTKHQLIKNKNTKLDFTDYVTKEKKTREMIVVDYSKIEQQKLSQIRNVPVYFPYEPYPLQLKYMQSIIETLKNSSNALLQSPTGTGKTLCLLSSVLSWVEHETIAKQLKDHQRIRVIYLSRTHTQLKQVQKQLQKTCFRPTLANFGSRDQFCVKSEFEDFKGRDLMEACSKGVKLVLKARRRLQIDEQGERMENVEGGESGQKDYACQFYKSEGEYLDLVEKMYKNKIIDSEKIKKDGEYYGFCPYYYPFQIQQKADLIFMPYNYILDIGLLPKYKDIIQSSVIIFDQAHNVPESACEGRSLAVTSGIFDRINVQLAKLEPHPRMSPQLKVVSYQYSDFIKAIAQSLANYRKRIENHISHLFNSRNSNGQQYESEDIQRITKPLFMRRFFYQWFYPYQLKSSYDQMTSLQKKQIHQATLESVNKLVEKACMLIEALKQTFDGIFQNLEKFMGFLKKISELIRTYEDDMPKQWWNEEINHYRFSVKVSSKDQSAYQLKLVCLTPSLTFTQICKLNPHSIILTSGTLSPLNSWQKQLKIKFSTQLQNPHIIEKDQLHMATVCKNLKGNTMNFSYNEIKNRHNIFTELVQSVCNILEIVPHGALIIFPSYRIINQFKNQIKYNRENLVRMKNAKDLLFEERGTDDYLLRRFKQKAMTKKGAALFCVCRGKVTEGLDFSDELCRAVIFIGVPFPNIKDQIIKEKKEYCDKLSKQCRDHSIKALTGDQWYNLNTMRAVNQGIGRVIRHINDFGMIFLLDDRYEQTRMKNLLPYWSKINYQAYYNFAELKENISLFFQQMQKKFPERKIQCENIQNQDNQSTTQTNKPKNAFQILMGREKRISQNKKEAMKRKSMDSRKKMPSISDFL